MISRGASEKDYILGLSTFHFPQKDENSSENGIQRIRFGQNRTSRKGPTMRQNIVLSDFEERRVFYFPPICVSFSYFLPHHRKWSLSKMCIFIISHHREMTFWEVLIFDVAPSTKTTFQKVLIFMVWYFRIAEKSVLTCVIVPLQNYFAEYLSGNCARDIYFFAELCSIFFPLCDFISQLCRHALASLIGWDGRTTGATFYKLSETWNRQGSWKLLIVIKGYDELYTSFTKSGKDTKDCNNYQPPVSGKKRSKPGQLHLFPIPWLPQR